MHTIRKMSVEVNRSGKADAFAVGRETSAWANEVLLPEMDRVFSSLPDTSEHVQIDRLEIELNSTDADAWGEDVLPQIKSELIARLIPLLHGRPDSRAERLSPQAAFLQTLKAYLRFGVLPWSSSIRSRGEWDEAISAWLSTPDVAALKSQLVELLSEPATRFRFVQSLAPAAMKKSFAVFFSVPDLWEEWSDDLTRMTRAAAAPVGNAGLSEFLLKALGQDLLENLAGKDFVFTALAGVQAAETSIIQVISDYRIGPESFAGMNFVSKTFAQAKEKIELENSFPGRRDLEQWEKLRPIVEGKLPPAARRRLENTTADQLNATGSKQPQRPEVDGIFIANAGIVLLAPYLPTFFDRLGVVKNGEMIDAGLAALLIHYLATGSESAAEFQLALPKVLCGVEIEQALALPDAIPETVKTEAANLLLSVIEHWSILQNTSPEGLRESFLQRPGKISLTEKKEWLLQVEQKAYDMLLQQLPWSFHLIKLPWMKTFLRTEWVE